jgi:hypothetical protein
MLHPKELASMVVTQEETPLAPARNRSTGLPQLITGLLGGLVALGLVFAGAAAIMFGINRDNAALQKAYPPDLVNGVLAYDVMDSAPTSYGWITETVASVTNSEETSEINFSLSVDNRTFLPMKAPVLGQLRVINPDGTEASYLSGGWHNQIVLPYLSASGDFRFAAPPAGGMLLLEYREHADDVPIRIAVGYTQEHPDAAQPSL